MALAAARAAPLGAAVPGRSCAPVGVDSSALVTKWMPPLDRLVTAHANDISLRDALDRVAAAARLRMSYSAEQLPLSRAVCVAADAVPVGRVLAGLLAGTGVQAVGVGGDQIVLAPRRETTVRPSGPEMASGVGILDRVVVTGSATGGGARERELSVGLNVLDGHQLARDNTGTVSDALDGYVPGVWSWAQSPSTMVSSYASIRGASSFGLSYPKVYIDGIEVANPLLLTRFNPGAIERIEVIRGPQGSALYGTDAISGVVNIVTRHEGASPDGSRATVRSTAGWSQTSFANDVLAQDHSVSIATGTSARSADLHLAGGSIGSFIPDGYSRDFMATGSARTVGTNGSLSATARLFIERAGTPDSPLVALPPRASDDTGAFARDVPQSVSEYTVGATGTRTLNDRWTATLVAGIDGYRLTNVQTNLTPIPTVLDSALRAAEGGASRGTLRASAVYQLNSSEATHATLTLTAEQATLRVSAVPTQTSSTQASPQPHTTFGTPRRTLYESTAETTPARVVTWQSSTGLVAQTNVSLDNRLFATGGLRFEHDSRLSATDQLEVLPMLGAAGVVENGPFTVKVRAAYGKGIRPPTTPTRLQFWQTQNAMAAAQGALGPERQSGIEAGIDVLVRNAFTFQATRFDQRASGLIQPVGMPADSMEHGRRMMYVPQNVGEISNRGWELQATANASRLSLTGTMSFVDSRVARLAQGYGGDLMPGDRMLQVPARMESLNASWTATHWHASLGASRALDWVNYDELALSRAVAAATSAREVSGVRLRQYWMTYDGGTRLRASAARDLRDIFAVEISADNLLNHQTGEPDNITVIPGRTLMTGIRVKF